MQDFTLPEVTALHQKPRFFRDDAGRDMIEIAWVGSKDTIIKKVQPEHMAAFRDEWNSFCDGSPLKKRDGTPLSDIRGVTDQQIEKFVSLNVHTAEELAALSDAQCQALGHGTLTARSAAREMLATRKLEADDRARQMVSRAAATIGPKPAEAYASQTEMAEIKSSLAELTNSVAALAQAVLAKGKPGRPKKQAEE